MLIDRNEGAILSEEFLQAQYARFRTEGYPAIDNLPPNGCKTGEQEQDDTRAGAESEEE